MNKTVQCKDIPDKPILEYLLKHKGHWCSQWDIAIELPANIPLKLILAKMKSLIKRGLVSGCACGCRGDFEITPKGETLL